MQTVSSSPPKAPVLRAARGQHLLPGLPSKLTQLLLLTDLAPGSSAAVECAIELAGLFSARVALMNAEPLRSGHHPVRDELAPSPDADPARPALLCLMWEVRQHGVEVGLCTDAGHTPEHVWRTATDRQVDLIVLADVLFQSSSLSANRAENSIEGAPCPLLIVADQPNLPLAAGGLNFR